MTLPLSKPPHSETRKLQPLILGREQAMTRREKMGLEAIWSHFCDQVVVHLTPVLRTRVSLKLQGFGPRRYLHYLDDRERDAPLLHFALDRGGRAFFSTPLSLLLDLFDAMMGGCGRLDLARSPYVTEIEAHLLRAPLHALLTAYQEAWGHLQFAPRLEPDYVEFNPYRSPICTPNESVLVCVFELEMPYARGPLELVLPWAPLRHDLVRPAAKAELPGLDIPGSTRLELGLRLGGCEVPFQDLLDLQVGDMFMLDRQVGQPLEVTVNGVPKFLGHPGVRQGLMAARVCTLLEP